MKKYVLFENRGLLEVMALFMIGASTKRDSPDKIGRFGSGFKYTLAKVMRDKLDIRIFSGENEITISTEPFMLRDTEFHSIVINGQQTSLTTAMGPDWKIWQIVRELWCNALDEGDADLRKDVEHVAGRDGYTRVFLEINDEVREVLNYWDTYFAADREDIVLNTPEFKVFRPSNGKQLYYRRGIKVHDSEKIALYHYDCFNFEINEERVVTSEWNASYHIVAQLARHATIDIAQNIMRNASREKTVENGFDWDYAGTLNSNWADASKTFDYIVLADSAGWYMDMLANTNNYALVTSSLAKKLSNIGVRVSGMTADGKRKGYKEIHELNRKQEFLLNDTVKVLASELGYEMKYPITIVEFESEHILAQADVENKMIYLSPKLFDMGRRKIALALMEEQEHIYNKLADETRDFQNHLFSKWLAALEEKAGYFF